MECDLKGIIRYANKASLRTLRSIEHLLPVRANEVVGQNFDIFHKNPAHQRALLRDKSRLPAKAEMSLDGVDLVCISPGLTLDQPLVREAAARGLQAHQMAGILPDKARELFQIPDGIQVVTGISIGYPADPTDISSRDATQRTRKPLSDFVYSGRWGVTAGFGR